MVPVILFDFESTELRRNDLQNMLYIYAAFIQSLVINFIDENNSNAAV